MSRDLNDLVKPLQIKARQVLDACENVGVIMKPSFTVRSPTEQAILWRRSRKKAEINAMLTFLREQKADYLASVLDGVGPHDGDWATNALPGASFHQWGEAIDCFWQVGKEAVWSTTKLIDGVNGYQVYASTGEAIGLVSLKSIGDWPHLQLRKGSVTDYFGWKHINDVMKERFG